MKKLSQVVAALALICWTSAQAITFDQLAWIAKDQKLHSILTDHEIIKTFHASTACRAMHCFEYVICSRAHDYDTNKATYSVTRISGASIFFKEKLEFTTSNYESMPEYCK